jgi:hypothetical protein
LQFRNEGKKNFINFFDKALITKIGKQSNFLQRKARQITPYNFVLGFLISCSKGQSTFSSWAFQIGLLSGNTVSKQAVFDRMSERAVAFAEMLLQKALLQQSTKNIKSALFSTFNKVLLQDSTTLKLPPCLSSVFPGNQSHGEQKAIARIQSIIDIKAMRFIDFVLGSFTQNDQSASGSILQWASKGDIVIRDMGYFVIDVFAKMAHENIHFLSRLRFGVKLYDKHGKEILLKALLKGNKVIDRWVYMGIQRKVLVRLVMIPVPKKQRAERVRKAKQDRDKRLNHSAVYYQWLGYGVYITSVPKDVWLPKQVAQAYGVRWQIEIIFKSWKSGFHLQKILHEGCTNEHRVRVSIYLMLLFICLFMLKIYLRYKDCIERKTGKIISLIKLSRFYYNNFNDIFSIPDKVIKNIIATQCCYDKRSDRIHLVDLFKNYNF